MAHKDLGGTQSDSDMVPQPAEIDRVQSGGMCSCKRVHAPLSDAVQQSSNIVANGGCAYYISNSNLVMGMGMG
jgi:hypothetical protein